MKIRDCIRVFCKKVKSQLCAGRPLQLSAQRCFVGEKEDLQLCEQRLAAVCAALRTEGICS